MRKRHFGRLLSAVLSATMVFTSVIPSYAMEGVDPEALEESQEDPEDVAEDSAEDLVTEIGEEPVEEVPEEAPIVEDDESSILVQGTGKYTVVFSANAAAEEITGSMNPQEITCGQATALTANAFERAGYTFANWNTVAEPTGAESEKTFADKAEVTDIADEDGSVTLYAQWTAIPATTVSASFDLNYGDALAKTISDIPEGTKVLAVTGIPAITGRTGYTFDAWYAAKAQDGTLSQKVDDTTVVADGTTYYAGWTANTYEVTLDKNSGDDAVTGLPSGGKITVTYDATYEGLPTTLTREGYDFDGWYTDATNGTKVSATDKVEITGDKTLYAHWTENTPPVTKVTVTFNKGAGTWKNEEITEATTTQEYTIGEAYGTFPEVVAPENKEFAGWYTKAEDGVKVETTTEASAEVENLYAVYTDSTTTEEYTVTFDLNAVNDKQSIEGKPDAKKVAKGAAFGELPAEPTSYGYDFGGWLLEKNGTELLTATTEVNGDMTVYAKWTAKEITITLDKNCKDDVTGMPENNKVTVTYGGTYSNLPVLTREGYDFYGWFTAKERGNEVSKDDTVKKAEDVTLYAQWTIKQIDVTFNWNDESGLIPVSESFNIGSKVLAIAPAATRVGYTLEGWYSTRNSETGELSGKVDKNTVAEDKKTYYAGWKANEYTVKFNANGGKGTMAAQKFTYGTAGKLNKNESIKKANYDFVGWALDKDSTTAKYTDQQENILNLATENGAVVTLYAVWVGKEATLTYDYGYDEVSDDDYTLRYNDSYPVPVSAKLKRPGFYFEGWFDGKKKIDITTAKFTATEAKTLTAKWTEVTYKATFNSNNAKKKTKTVTLDKANSDAMNFADVFTAADAAGLTFTGWATQGTVYEKDNFKQSAFVTELMGEETSPVKVVTATLYAQWESAGKYNIKFNANLPKDAQFEVEGFSDGHIEEVNFAEPYPLTGSEFTLNGYTLTGWKYTNDKGKIVSVKPTATLTAITADNNKTVELSAQWKEKTYTIKYNANGGTFKKNVATTVKYKVDETTRAGVPLINYEKNGEYYLEKADADKELTRRGYTFGGWNPYAQLYYGKDCYKDMNLVAEWDAVPHPLILELEGGTYNGATGTYAGWNSYNFNYRVSLGAPVREGYTFLYWKGMGANGKDKLIKKGVMFALKDLEVDNKNAQEEGPITLTAVYKANTNKITYKLEGGKIKGQPKNYVTGADNNKAIPVPTKDGYHFTRWTATLNGSAEDIATILDGNNKIKANVSGNLELTATYEENTYNIVFKDNKGVTTYEIDGYDNLGYTESVGFTAAAEEIEDSTGFEGVVKGFALTKDSSKVKYGLHQAFSKLAGKTTTNDELTLYVVAQPDSYSIRYNLDEGVTLKNPVYEYKKPTAAAGLKLKTTAVKKGFTFKGFVLDSGDLDAVVTKDGYVTAIAKDATSDIVLTPVFDNENYYTITLMPNAKDVTSAIYGAVNAKKGVQFEDANGEKEFAFSGSNTDADASDLVYYVNDWERTGYELIGFSTTKTGKPVDTLSGLSDGKKKAVTLYAVWEANEATVTYEYAVITRDGEDYVNDITEDNLGIKFAGTTTQTFGKAFTPKKLSLVGFTFKGWRVAAGSDSDYKVVYTDKTNTYVKSVAKDNTADVNLEAVFEENFYNLYVDPNGGSYNGSTKKQFVRKVYYSDNISKVSDDNYGILGDIKTGLSKKGSKLDGLSTTKNYKGWLSTENAVRRLSAKNKANVTVYAVWYNVFLDVPTITANINISSSEMTVSVDTVYGMSDIEYEIQYSPSAAFLYDVQSQTTDAYSDVTVPVISGQQYYVRARMLRPDSTGDSVASNWSKTVRANKQGNETVAITVKNVLDNADPVVAGVVNVTKSEKIAAALETAKKNEKDGYKFVGFFVAGEDGKPGEALSTEAKAVKATTIFAKFTKEETPATVTVTFDLNYEGAAAATVLNNVAADAKVMSINDIPSATREGFRLEGWYATKNSETGVLSDKVDNDTVVTDGKTYYAKWVETVTVTFDANGGKWADESTKKIETVDKGAAYPAIPDPAPTMGGNTFGGWYTDPTNDETAYPNSGTVSASVTYKAKWTPEAPATVTVTFDLNGGEAVGTPELEKAVAYNAAYPEAPALSVATKDGYTLTGWNIKNDGTGEAYPTTGNVTADVTYYAVWTPITYTIQFVKGDEGASGEAPASITATYGVEYDLPANTFTYEGNTFAGWKLPDNTVEMTGKVSNLTTTANETVIITATWTPAG